MKILWVVFLAGAGALFAYHRCYTPPAVAPGTLYGPGGRLGSQQCLDRDLRTAGGPAPVRFCSRPIPVCHLHGLPGGAGGGASLHHSSSPTQTGLHASTIKASGDFTSLIGQVKPGDPVAVQAPFRHYLSVSPKARDLVFIAGGIGITPLMSNLRHMRDTGADRRCCCSTPIKLRQILSLRENWTGSAGQDKPQVEVVHILTQPGSDWQGETGRLDRETQTSLRRPPGREHLFLCYPPHDKEPGGRLTGLGVPLPRISYEYLSL